VRILAWRDLLSSCEEVERWKKDRSMRFIEALEKFVDLIVIFGQESLIDARTYFSFPTGVADKICHLGYVTPEASESQKNSQRLDKDLLISFGSGQHRETLLTTVLPKVLKAAKEMGYTITIYLGLYWHREQLGPLERQLNSSDVIRSYTDSVQYLEHLKRCSVAVIAGGYNSLMEALYYRTPVIVVEDGTVPEVTARSEIFEKQGLLSVISSSMRVPDMKLVIREAATSRPGKSFQIDFCGCNRFVQLAKDIIEYGRAADRWASFKQPNNCCTQMSGTGPL